MKENNNGGQGGQQNLTDLPFVVSGEEVFIKANLNNKLVKAIEDALQQTGNANARPIGDWRVRYNNNPITDWNRKIGEYGFTPGNFIYLSLDSGTGGNVVIR